MDKARAAKVTAAVYVTAGVLWLALTGTCTWNYARMPSNGWEGLWPVGLWFVSIGVLPLAIGLRSFVPERVVGGALSLAGVPWLAFGVKWLVAAFIQPGTAASGGALAFLALLWGIFQAPGAWMLLAGVKMLRSKRNTPRSEPGPPVA